MMNNDEYPTLSDVSVLLGTYHLYSSDGVFTLRPLREALEQGRKATLELSVLRHAVGTLVSRVKKELICVHGDGGSDECADSGTCDSHALLQQVADTNAMLGMLAGVFERNVGIVSQVESMLALFREGGIDLSLDTSLALREAVCLIRDAIDGEHDSANESAYMLD